MLIDYLIMWKCFIFQHLSTSPEQEPAHFEDAVRAALVQIRDHPKPLQTVFKEGKPRQYKLEANGTWTRCNWGDRGVSVIGTAICDTLNLYMLTSLCVILSLSGRRLVSATFTCKKCRVLSKQDFVLMWWINVNFCKTIIFIYDKDHVYLQRMVLLLP